MNEWMNERQTIEKKQKNYKNNLWKIEQTISYKPTGGDTLML